MPEVIFSFLGFCCTVFFLLIAFLIVAAPIALCLTLCKSCLTGSFYTGAFDREPYMPVNNEVS
jgi:hypothetical protein